MAENPQSRLGRCLVTYIIVVPTWQAQLSLCNNVTISKIDLLANAVVQFLFSTKPVRSHGEFVHTNYQLPKSNSDRNRKETIITHFLVLLALG